MVGVVRFRWTCFRRVFFVFLGEGGGFLRFVGVVSLRELEVIRVVIVWFFEFIGVGSRDGIVSVVFRK